MDRQVVKGCLPERLGAPYFSYKTFPKHALIKMICSPPPQAERLAGGVCPRRAGPAPPRGALLLGLGRGRPHAHPERVLQRWHTVRRHRRELQTAQLPDGAGAERSAATSHTRTQVHPLYISGAHGHQAQ